MNQFKNNVFRIGSYGLEIAAMKARIFIIITFSLFMITIESNVLADNCVKLQTQQSIYVPVYAYIYYGNKPSPFHLTVTLSIRNTDTKNNVTVLSVDYFDTAGKLIKQYLKEPVKLGILETIRYVIKSDDKKGGSGAKFIVRWKSDEPVNEPLIEAIMISTASGQGISWKSRGREIIE